MNKNESNNAVKLLKGLLTAWLMIVILLTTNGFIEDILSNNVEVNNSEKEELIETRKEEVYKVNDKKLKEALDYLEDNVASLGDVVKVNKIANLPVEFTDSFVIDKEKTGNTSFYIPEEFSFESTREGFSKEAILAFDKLQSELEEKNLYLEMVDSRVPIKDLSGIETKAFNILLPEKEGPTDFIYPYPHISLQVKEYIPQG